MLVFRKRAGIVLLHAGVALVMINELVVYSLHVEGQMQIQEGETVNYVQDIRTVELAVVDPSDPKTDDVVVVPRSLLAGQETDSTTRSCRSTCEVVEYLPNSALKNADAGQEEPGHGRARQGSGGRRSAPGRRHRRRQQSRHHGGLRQTVEKRDFRRNRHVPGRPCNCRRKRSRSATRRYDVALRFKRTYKPYSMQLHDVRFDKYLGTQTRQELFVGPAPGRSPAAMSIAT